MKIYFCIKLLPKLLNRVLILFKKMLSPGLLIRPLHSVTGLLQVRAALTIRNCVVRVTSLNVSCTAYCDKNCNESEPTVHNEVGSVSWTFFHIHNKIEIYDNLFTKPPIALMRILLIYIYHTLLVIYETI